MSIKKLQGFSVVNSAVGKQIAYAYSVVGEDGILEKSNVKSSYVVMDEDEKNLISQLEEKINNKLSSAE